MRTEPDRETVVEIKEELDKRLYARFDFNGAAAGLWNPPEVNIARRDRDLRLSTRIELRGRGAGADPLVTSLAGFAIVDRAVRSPAGGGSLRVEYSLAASAADLEYSATLPGAAGFELSFWLRPQDQERWEVMTLLGTDANDDAFTRGGKLSVLYEDPTNTPPLVVVDYDAQGCPSRPRVNMRPIVPSVPANAWTHLRIEVIPSLSEDEVEVIVESRGPAGPSTVSRQAVGFNFLAGKIYLLRLHMPDSGAAHLDDIRYSIHRTPTFQAKNADGLRTAWIVDRSPRGELQIPYEFQTPPAGRQFTKSVEPIVSLAAGYCDFPAFERIDIAAADATAASAYNYIYDAFASFIVGDPQSVAGFAGEFAAGMLGWGDLRDIVKNLAFAWPGGRDPNWEEFGLSVVGLALDVGQVVSGGGLAAPNAVIAVLKMLLSRLRPLAAQFPAARRIARFVANLLSKLLGDLRVRRILLGTQVTYTLVMVKRLIPPDFIDYFFDGITTADLERIAEYARALTPSFNPLSPPNPAQALQVAQLALDSQGQQRVADVIRTVVARVDTLMWFLNPVVFDLREFHAVTAFMRRLRQKLIVGDADNLADALVAQKRIDDLLDGAGTWRFPPGLRHASSARRSVVRAMDRLAPYLTRATLTSDPKAMRGLISFIAASGPHRADRMLRNLMPGGRVTPEAKRVLSLMDDAAAHVAGLARRDPSITPALQRQELNRLWSGLAARRGNNVSRAEGSYQGALAELEALSKRFFFIDSVNPLRRGVQLQDFGGAATRGRHAIESKYTDSVRGFWRMRRRTLSQYRRWAFDNDRVPPSQRIAVIEYFLKIPPRSAERFRFNELVKSLLDEWTMLRSLGVDAPKPRFLHAVPVT